jgi:hypothetical protein
MRAHHWKSVITVAYVSVSLLTPGGNAPRFLPGTNNAAPQDHDILTKFAHKRSYRHCHNMPRRMYCHAKERLPRNWPPNTNTPGRSRQPCWVNKKNCLF